MKIGYLIGALGNGGAERQLAQLACGMAERGHAVEVVCYDGPGALDATIEARGVRVHRMTGGSKLVKLQGVRDWARQFDPAVVHGFMKRASSLAVLANLPARRYRVVASDFSTASYARSKPILWASLLAFGLADAVATETSMNRACLDAIAPWLRRKTLVVRNGVDTGRFRMVERARDHGPFRFACVGTVYGVKNPVRVVEATARLRNRGLGEFRLDWFGRRGLRGDAAPSSEYGEAIDAARRLGVEGIVTFHGETRDVEHEYARSDALVHTSLQEGVPNAVVEAMACGLPLVVSSVSDLPLLVGEARNGFVCNELDPWSIADAMQRMLLTPVDERRAMGLRSRELADRWFGLERFLEEYGALYARLSGGR